MPSFPKDLNYRNRKLLDLGRFAPKCFSCGSENTGIVIPAHSNAMRHGHGMGLKAHDIPAFVCKTCHDIIDGRMDVGMTRDERHEMYLAAVYETFLWLLREGYLVVKS